MSSERSLNLVLVLKLTAHLEHIEDAVRRVKQMMHFQIEILVAPIADKHTPSDYLPGSDDFFFSHCDCISISMFLNALSRQNLWPLSAAVCSLSISKFCQRLEACDFGLPTRVPKSKRCAKCPEDIAGRVAKIRERALNDYDGLCLDCIKNPGKKPEEWTKCQLPHERFRGIPELSVSLERS